MADRTINGIRYEDYPSTKLEALEGSLKYFYTNKPCKYGHFAPRSVIRGQCYVCQIEANKKYNKTDKAKAYYKKYFEDITKQSKSYKNLTPEQKRKRAQHNRKYRLKHQKALNEKQLAKNLTPEQKLKKTQYERKYRNKALKNPANVIVNNIRNRMKLLFRQTKDSKKQAPIYELLDCNKVFLKKYIEKQFVKGMSWDNRSTWNIDHIIPLNFFVKHFDLNNIHVQKIASHYSNLQPLFKSDNSAKRDRIYIQHPESSFEKIVVDMNDNDYEIFVSLLKEEVQKKIQILEDKNTVKGIGKITDRVIKKYYEIVDEPR